MSVEERRQLGEAFGSRTLPKVAAWGSRAGTADQLVVVARLCERLCLPGAAAGEAVRILRILLQQRPRRGVDAEGGRFTKGQLTSYAAFQAARAVRANVTAKQVVAASAALGCATSRRVIRELSLVLPIHAALGPEDFLRTGLKAVPDAVAPRVAVLAGELLAMVPPSGMNPRTKAALAIYGACRELGLASNGHGDSDGITQISLARALGLTTAAAIRDQWPKFAKELSEALLGLHPLNAVPVKRNCPTPN